MAIKVIAISGDGNGAGKSTMARALVGESNIVSLASVMRQELAAKYPKYDWFNKAQEYKEGTLVAEEGNKTVRQVLIDYGQDKCKDDPWYWVRILTFKLHGKDGVFAIDDLRKLIEISHLRAFFGPENVCHIHVAFAGAKAESLYDNEKLKLIANYVFPRAVIGAALPAAHVPKGKEIRYEIVFETSSGAWKRTGRPGLDVLFVSRETAEQAMKKAAGGHYPYKVREVES